MSSCQKCGTKIESDDIYCPECGIKISLIKEPKKITINTILKALGGIIFFIILINIFKNNPLVAIIILIFFLIWTNILNRILKKLFNVEISKGVKIIITIILIALLFFAGQQISSQPTSKPKLSFERPEIEGTLGYEFIEKINEVVRSKNYGLLKEMFEKGVMTKDVFEDVNNVIHNKAYSDMVFELQGQNYYGDQVNLVVSVITHTNYGKVREQTSWMFQKKVNFENTNDYRWILTAIKPRLSNLRLSTRSFEKEAASKIESIKKPIISVSDISISSPNIQKN